MADEVMTASALVRRKQALDVLALMADPQRRLSFRDACREVGVGHNTIAEYMSDPEINAAIQGAFLGATMETIGMAARFAPEIAKVLFEKAADPDSRMADRTRNEVLRTSMDMLQMLATIFQQRVERQVDDNLPAPAAWNPPAIKLNVTVTPAPVVEAHPLPEETSTQT